MGRYIIILLVTLLSIPCEAQQMMGVPFFKNITAREYNAHNRNFDILCDKYGYTFVANFEGLLVYDNVKWHIVHTPGISRVIDLSRDKDGKVWFSGINAKGYVESIEGDSIHVKYVQTDKEGTAFIHERMNEINSHVDRWNNIEVYHRLKISNDRTLLATATAGVIAINQKGEKVWEINEKNGLCSNSITKLAYDGKGSVWGATDNGLFRISVSEIYSHFDEHEGLSGQVTSIAMAQEKLFVGTLQGLFMLEDGLFVKIEGIHQACWQLAETVRKNAIAATSDGVFAYGHSLHQLSTKMSLAILVENDDTFLSGELDGIYRRGYDGYEEKIDDINYTVQMQHDKRGGVWALTLGGEYYYLALGAKHFKQQKKGPFSLLFEFTDDKGKRWHTYENGEGLTTDNMDKDFAIWFEPFAKYSIQAMLINKDIAWIGGNFGLIRIDLLQSEKTKPIPPQIYMRSFTLDGQKLDITVTTDKHDPIGITRYSYRLHTNDPWSAWDDDPDIHFHNLAYGRYQLTIRCIDPYGQIAETRERYFRIPYPIYFRWYALLLYLILIGLLIISFFKYRTRQLKRRQQQLETVVNERTQELRLAQKELVRKEREATVGKLTKGLIDRILNPMNYINNFSHLTIGLTNELKGNLDEDEEKMTADIYDDCVDVIDMMKTNLEKIEQHGLSTTRILKAMEEMLKERSSKIESVDLTHLCQQNIEMLHNYYKEEIQQLGIQVEWQKPEQSISVDANAELLSKTIMSILANSVYAIRKKAEKNNHDLSAYQPVIRLNVVQEETPHIIFYDNGIGIEQSIIDKIFDPFFTTKPTAEASGVGLYLSQQIIQDFGGNITVKSEKDKYAEFTIAL
ncbi:MAG: hypothetical protein IJT97_05880 [Bacteroidaceae bacterium]|nr:hypothetical protein [Bacteroidaceae bacterium]